MDRGGAPTVAFPTRQPRYILPRRRSSAGMIADFFTAGQSGGPSAAFRILARTGVVRGWPHFAPKGLLELALQESARRYPWLDSAGVYLGTPRANAKPVVALCDTSRVRAVAKVGVTPLSIGLVRHEAGVLGQLGSLELSRVKTPSVLDRWSVDTSVVLVLEAFDLRRFPMVDPLADAQTGNQWMEAALEVAQTSPYAMVTTLVRNTAWWSRFVSGLERVEQELPGPDVRRFASFARSLGEGIAVPGASHGDFTTWNARRVDGGRWVVWDWERYSEDAIWGFDICNWVLYSRWSNGVQQAVDHLVTVAPEVLSHAPGPRIAVDLVVRLYLADITLRFLLDGQSSATEMLASVTKTTAR